MEASKVERMLGKGKKVTISLPVPNAKASSSKIMLDRDGFQKVEKKGITAAHGSPFVFPVREDEEMLDEEEGFARIDEI